VRNELRKVRVNAAGEFGVVGVIVGEGMGSATAVA